MSKREDNDANQHNMPFHTSMSGGVVLIVYYCTVPLVGGVTQSQSYFEMLGFGPIIKKKYLSLTASPKDFTHVTFVSESIEILNEVPERHHDARSRR